MTQEKDYLDLADRVEAATEAAEAIWKRACVGREGYCSSDLQHAAKWAIGEAFRIAEQAARSAALPAGYQWSDGNREKFNFGRDTAADAVAHASRVGDRNGQDDVADPHTKQAGTGAG